MCKFDDICIIISWQYDVQMLRVWMFRENLKEGVIFALFLDEFIFPIFIQYFLKITVLIFSYSTFVLSILWCEWELWFDRLLCTFATAYNIWHWSMFTLQEYELVQSWGLKEVHLIRANVNALRASFLPEEEKSELLKKLFQAYEIE